jgi:thiol-disulfide isomerase/thioredoxin
MRTASGALALALLVPAAGGCGRGQAAEPGGFVQTFQAGSAAELDVPTLGIEAYRRLVADQAAQGHVVVVNFWATWCGPCVEEFPELVRLQDENWTRGVRLITISVDEPEVLESGVKPFLFTHRITGAAFLMDMAANEDFLYRLSDDWSGGIPHTFIYDRAGRIARSLTGRQTYERFQAAVDEVLGH